LLVFVVADHLGLNEGPFKCFVLSRQEREKSSEPEVSTVVTIG
jgi:hypothetical protein